MSDIIYSDKQLASWECALLGEHLKHTDDDGYCNSCGAHPTDEIDGLVWQVEHRSGDYLPALERLAEIARMGAPKPKTTTTIDDI